MKTGVHQPQLQLRRPEVLPHHLATVGWRIVPDDPQRPRMLFLQLRQEGNRGPAVAVALQFQPFHLARLQAHRCIVAGLLPLPRTAGVHQGCLSPQHPLAPQLRIGTEVGRLGEENLGFSPLGLLPTGGLLRHEGLPFGLIPLDQTLLGVLEGKPQPVPPVQATAAAPAEAEAFPDKPMHHLPIPVGQLDARRGGRLLHRPFQLLLLRLVQGGRGGTTGLLEDPGRRPSRTAGRCPTSDSVGVPLQRRRRRRCPPALSQQQDGLPPPPLPLPGCGRQNHPPPQVLDSPLPLFQRPVYLPHPHHQPFAISETSYPGSFTNLPHASAHFTLALV